MTAIETPPDPLVGDPKEALNEKATTSGSTGKKKPKREYQFREQRLGIWTLYYPITNSWREYLPALESLWVLYDMAKSLPIVWRFVLETLSLGPIFFAAYFVSSTLVGVLPALQLYNSSNTLEFIESVVAGKHVDREKLQHITISYLWLFISGLFFQPTADPYYNSVFLYTSNSDYSKYKLALILPPLIILTSNQKLRELEAGFRVHGQFLRGWHHSWLLEQKPLALVAFIRSRNETYYAMVTDNRWLRMEALFDLGTKPSYRKEVIADNLEGFINSQYDKDRKSLGDTPEQRPWEQVSDRRWFTYNDFDAIFDALPLLVFAWNSLRTKGGSDLSSLVLMQQATSSLQTTFLGIIYGGTNIASLFKNVMSLYDVLEIKPSMADGYVSYPEEENKDKKGVAIEFKSVSFQYPMADKAVLKDMSFSIGPGQLCVIVGENGCGKSTTINLITRMYDSTSGEVLVDGRPLKDFKLASYRATTSVMYQDYQHLPLTIHENILLGRPDCENPKEAVEEAARLGGAFDFVQKLPLKFETNLEPQQTGYANTWEDDDDEETNTYQKFIDTQKATKLSGGEWQRLALSKTFMKNSEKVRLLCYDEPSASLDPKAEYEMFERLRQLRGGKTMIFVTHRFGHLTKYADLNVVLVSTVLAGVKKSTGYTPQTNLITEPTLKSVADSVLGLGETVFSVVQGNAVTSAYFKREGR
ncbi:unnamed protein product [Rhizoctonia solani]|uniref:ABC transporter domain-containing protein n=1 Tax=Rhizoctonia solani TaxID=456999 RepID=A0A8H2X8U7_9AGAM|nr:unnamed protein product [Rhizoctonia solani]